MSLRTQTRTIAFTLDQLNRRAANRPKGYASDILSYARSTGSDRWEISREHWDMVALRHRADAGFPASRHHLLRRGGTRPRQGWIRALTPEVQSKLGATPLSIACGAGYDP